MNSILKAWNESSEKAAIAALMSCCAASRWARAVTTKRPIPNEESLYKTADREWAAMEQHDWMEAFRAHPRIGECKPAQASTQSQSWSTQEQASVATAEASIIAGLATANRQYESTFGFTCILCATGKSAEEMLNILRRRLTNHHDTELCEAAEQQRQITQIRLRKWLNP